MGERFDVAIIGAGWSGIGLAHEAARNGFRVAVYDSAPNAGTLTSCNSLRIVHGGFRYLQTGALARTQRSAEALRLALHQYPEFVTPLSSLLPLSRWGLKSPIPVRVALAVYHRLAKVPVQRRGCILGQAEFDAAVPLLCGMARYGALQWWDGLVVDPRGWFERLVQEATELGAEFNFRSPVRSVAVTPTHAVVSLAGAASVEAKVVFNAAGPLIRSVDLLGVERPERRWCRGFNLIVRPKLASNYAVAGSGNGRMLFAVPRGDGTAIGTWYLPCHDGADRAEISPSEVAQAVRELYAAYPGFIVEMNDVAAVESGVLPLGGYARLGEPIPQGQESTFVAGRYVEILSTKFTTFMVQAQSLLQSCAHWLQ
jgi:glycerol-3-phosphate dehydrogenase